MKMLPEFLFIPIFVTGLNGVIHNPKKITSKVGSSVTFWCSLDPPEDLSNFAADCRQVDENFKSKGTSGGTVHSYRGGEEHFQPQMPEFINRTHLNLTDLKRGIVSVEITSVQTSDSGNYKCLIPNHRVNCTYALIVVEDASKGDPSSTGPPLKEVTTPHGGDAETKVYKKVIIIAVAVAAAAAAAAAVVIAVIIVLGALPITDVVKWFNWRSDKQNKMEMTPMNGRQGTDGHEEPRSTAENGSIV